MSSNLAYKTDNLQRYFSAHRKTWSELYPSERKVIETFSLNEKSSVIDMGCACGGLGLALYERFRIKDYTGVDINPQCIALAPELTPWGTFYAGDFIEIEKQLTRTFDLAFSLGCADWNVRTNELLTSLFRRVTPGGSLIFSARMTNDPSVASVIEAEQSLSYLEYGGEPTQEWAPYKVYTLNTILSLLQSLPEAGDIYAYGYWGEVPKTVKNLPLTKVFFVVFSLTRQPKQSEARETIPPKVHLDFSGTF